MNDHVEKCAAAVWDALRDPSDLNELDIPGYRDISYEAMSGSDQDTLRRVARAVLEVERGRVGEDVPK